MLGGLLDVGNMNPAPKHLRNLLIDHKRMEIEFTGKCFRILRQKSN